MPGSRIGHHAAMTDAKKPTDKKLAGELAALDDQIDEAVQKSDISDREVDDDLAEDAGLGEVLHEEDVAPGA